MLDIFPGAGHGPQGVPAPGPTMASAAHSGQQACRAALRPPAAAMVVEAVAAAAAALAAAHRTARSGTADWAAATAGLAACHVGSIPVLGHASHAIALRNATDSSRLSGHGRLCKQYAAQMNPVLSTNLSIATLLRCRHVSRSPDARARARFYPEHRSSIEQRALERNRFTYPGA